MNLTAGMPAWTLRGGVACAVALILISLAAQGVGVFPLGIVALLGVLSVTAPATPAPAFLIVATAVAVAVVSDDAFDIRVLALVPLIHLVHIGCALTAVIPGTARVHVSALRPAAVRFVLVQLAVAALAAVASLVPETVTPAALEVLALLAATTLAVLATRLIMKRPK
ncbi:hypothetical protein ALI144C_30190 [Actinosynnema sp. ALI-1.44]|nr:hypothetical protein ALI144C_30190 [Actinosynnema sp. ALI-1.44]